VDAYIALTDNMRKRFIRGGLPVDKLFIKSNFLDPDPMPREGEGDFALFVGRLSQEKGVGTLLKAWESIGDAIPLRVAGTGPLESLFANGAVPSSVECLGWQSPEEVLRLMGAARFIVIPSEWYEGQPRTAIEAFAKGLPIIASNIGAMAEMVENGRSGLLFPPGDAGALAARVRWALENRDSMVKIGAEGRLVYERNFTAEANFGMLMEIYERVVASRRRVAAGMAV
jgi:glycosyltransferase involved in cell wall biosynthesis